MKFHPLRIAALAILVLAVAPALLWRVREVGGLVLNEAGQPIPGATVRLRATAVETQTDSHGRFALKGFPRALRIRLTAWADGHYVAGRWVWPWDGDITLELSPYAVPDNPGYEWILPVVQGRTPWELMRVRARLDPTGALAPDALFFSAAEGLTLGCQDCHAEVIYDQWVRSAHSLGFGNPRFASMYSGTDVTGQHQSPATRYGTNRDYGRIPLLPDAAQAYFGPGYKLDFPDTSGNCAACHLPAAALAAPYGVDPRDVRGVNALGSHCDFCHKIVAVKLDQARGLPYENMPGVLSLEMMRPAPDKQIFFGPYDDVDAGVDTYLPLNRQSEFCAACHYASFWGIPVYQSFAEWRASPYSDPARAAQAGLESVKTCQDCHMKPDGITTNFAPGRAGQERDPAEIFTHSFPGASDEALLQNAVTMTVSARLEGGRVLVEVTILNDQTGHHVPTDSPLREMILLVRSQDDRGTPLDLLYGDSIPEWGGRGDPVLGNFAGQPGKIYERLLSELWTEISPTGAYWNPTRVVNDNRLPAFGSDTSRFEFARPPSGAATVRITLLFRRAYIELQDQKGWSVPDIVMEEQTLILPEPK